MDNIKEKIATLDEQIQFINDARKLLEANDEAMIIVRADNVPMLRCIEMNLITVKRWIELPHFHQAAMVVLDKACALYESYIKEHKTDDFSREVFIELVHDILLVNQKSEELFLSIGSLCLIAVGKEIKEKEVNNG